MFNQLLTTYLCSIKTQDFNTLINDKRKFLLLRCPFVKLCCKLNVTFHHHLIQFHRFNILSLLSYSSKKQIHFSKSRL